MCCPLVPSITSLSMRWADGKMNSNQTHPIDLVSNQHFYNVVACCVGFQFIQPVFKLRKSVTLCDVIYCKKKKKNGWKKGIRGNQYDVTMVTSSNLSTLKETLSLLSCRCAFSLGIFSLVSKTDNIHVINERSCISKMTSMESTIDLYWVWIWEVWYHKTIIIYQV